MAENTATGAKKLKLDHDDDLDKNPDLSSQTLKSGEESSLGECDKCKIYETTIENLTVNNSKLHQENEKLRGVIKEFVLKTGENPDNWDHILARSQKKEKDGIFADNSDKSSENQSATQKALATSVILRKVFEYFSDRGLLKLRPVCKFWAQEASVCLLGSKKKERLKILLLYNKEENTVGKSGVGGLSDLINLMTSGVEAGRKFPCAYFLLTCPNLLTVPDVAAFLEKFGYLIKTLDLELLYLENSSKTNCDIAESLRSLLFKWALNLKTFYFRADPLPRGDPLSLFVEGAEPSSSSTLPNLEIISWINGSSPQIYIDLLNSAVNLKKVATYPCFRGFEHVVRANKGGAIKAAQFNIGHPLGDSVFALASEHCFQIEEIKIKCLMLNTYDQNSNTFSFPEYWGPKVQLLNTVLRNNRNSLTKIKSRNFGMLSECGLEFPAMPNLKTLEIKTDFESWLPTAQNLDRDKFFRVFSKGLDVSKTFPSLAHISWRIVLNDNFSSRESSNPFLQLPMLDMMGTLTSVRSLTINIAKAKYLEFLRRISICVPNVRNLIVEYSEKFDSTFLGTDAAAVKPTFPEIVRIIWELFQGLEEIHLILYLNDPPKRGLKTFLRNMENDRPDLLGDSAITGLDLETVQTLAGISPGKSELAEKTDDMSRVQNKDLFAKSVLDMKSLRYLKITLQSENDFPIFTHVSGTHGFGLMSNLTVVIEAPAEKNSVIEDPKGLMSPNLKFYQIPRKRKEPWWRM